MEIRTGLRPVIESWRVPNSGNLGPFMWEGSRIPPLPLPDTIPTSGVDARTVWIVKWMRDEVEVIDGHVIRGDESAAILVSVSLYDAMPTASKAQRALADTPGSQLEARWQYEVERHGIPADALVVDDPAIIIDLVRRTASWYVVTV